MARVNRLLMAISCELNGEDEMISTTRIRPMKSNLSIEAHGFVERAAIKSRPIDVH